MKGIWESWLSVQTGNFSQYWRGQCAESALVINVEYFNSEIKVVEKQTAMRVVY